MATIGLDQLYMATITEDTGGTETYGTPKKLAKAISAGLSVELLEAILYADDGAAVVVKEFKSGALELNVDAVGRDVAAELTGAQIDDNGVLVSGADDRGAPVAIGFRAKKANGQYRYIWLYRVQFGIPDTNLTTKGENITFSTPTIKGTVMRRNKADTSGGHPWRAEVDSDDTSVLPATVESWFTLVYEPAFAVNP